jgi:radical SAM protein with 4Fe4S-binding SPASM domain
MTDIWATVKQTLQERHIPFEIALGLTRRCNLSCCHCYNIKDDTQMTPAQVRNIARQLRRAGTLFVVLTGGEVFTHPDILDIAASLRQAGMDIKIFTNGTLITVHMIRELKKILPNEIGISIQGAQARTHDAITGVAGSFEKALQAVARLKQAGIIVTMKCTLMRENFDEYHRVIALAKQLGVTYIIDPVISPRDSGDQDVLRYRLTEQQLEAFYLDEIKTLDSAAEQDKDFFCNAGSVFGSISVTGDVYPCIQLPLRIGNVFKKEFKYIWNTAPALMKMRSSRHEPIPACAECRVSWACTRCPGLAFLEDKDLYGPSTAACMNAKAFAKVSGRRHQEQGTI